MLPPAEKEKRHKLIKEMELVHAELMGTNAAATIEDAIAVLEARRAEPPFASQPGRKCTIPQMYDVLSKRDGKRKRDAAAGAAAAATAGAGEGGGSAPAA